jgi:membrane peptidoglycan carboxypeptidase
MQMPMQIGLDEVITMLLSRVESLAMNDENNKTRANIVLRVLYKKGLVTDQEIRDSVKEEHRMLRELGMIQEEPGDDVVNMVAENILQWVRGDTAAIKRSMEEYERKLKEYAKEESRKSSLTVASPDVLHQLDRLAPPPGSGSRGGKLII